MILPADERGNPFFLMDRLVEENLFPSSAFTFGNSRRIYIKSCYLNDLDAALMYAVKDIVIYLQSLVRGFITRCLFRRKMTLYLHEKLSTLMETDEIDGLRKFISSSKRWGIAQGSLHTAVSRLQVLQRDEELKKRLVEAAETFDSYKVILG